jgi:hypothetical protein
LRKTTALSHDAQMIRMALVVAKLEGKAREQRKALKETSRELRYRRRELKAYVQSLTEQPIEARPDTAPMRLFGETERVSVTDGYVRMPQYE